MAEKSLSPKTAKPPNKYRPLLFLIPLIATSVAVTVHYDTQVDNLICHSLTPALENLAQNLSHSAEGQWPVVAGLLALLVGAARKQRRWLQLGLALLLCPTVGGLTATVTKNVIGRARPEKSIPEGWYGPFYQGHWTAGTYNLSSFPSGHSATAAATAATLVILGNRLGWLLTLWAGGVAWSRIALHCHHYSDTYAGILVGLIMTSLTIHWLHKSKSSAALFLRSHLHHPPSPPPSTSR